MADPEKPSDPPPLPPSAQKAVHECQEYFSALNLPPGTVKPPAPRHMTPTQAQFEKRVAKVEDREKDALYTPARYDEEILRAKQYTDAFIDHWQGRLPEGQSVQESREALKMKFRAIIDGGAGLETGWSPETVKESRERPHTGVFQTEWGYMAEALSVYRTNPAMMKALEQHPDDLAALRLSAQSVNKKGLPVTSFTGQGAAFAAMAMKSYENFVSRGGRPDDFDGSALYQEHLLGPAGAGTYRSTLETASHRKGHPGISKSAYDGNYLAISNPLAPVNDLNPARTVFTDATAADIRQMLHDKFVNARNSMADKGASEERIAAFEQAFLPEWKDTAVKESDIARVRQLHELGSVLRESPEAQENACRVLAPMPPLKGTKPGGPAK